MTTQYFRSAFDLPIALILMQYLLIGPANEAIRAGGIIAANNDEPSVALLTKLEVKHEHEKEFSKILLQYVSHAIAQEGNIMAEAYQEQGVDATLWLIERWANPKELDGFSKNEKAQSLQALMKKSLEGPPKIYRLRDLEPLSKQEWRVDAGKEDQPLTIMLFVDAKSGTEQEFRDLYHTAMPHFRGEPGVVTYQLSEIEGDGTQFVTYEKFRSKDAFDFHLQFHAVKPLVEYLEKNVKQPPFQNGLHNLSEIAPITRR